MRSDRTLRRYRNLLHAAGAAAILLVAGAALADASSAVTELPSSVKLEQWETKPGGNWITGALQHNNSDYVEGEAVPFRLVVPSGVGPGQYMFSVCRNYENSTKRGYLYLAPFDTDRPASPGGPIGSTSGNFSVVNATLDAINEVEARGACKAGDRETIVTITKGSGESYVLWGGHLASPLDPGVGAGNSAAAWPGASLHMKTLRPSKDVAIQTCTVDGTPTPPRGTATATKTPKKTATPATTPTPTQRPPTNTPEPSSTTPPEPSSTGTLAPTDTPVPTGTPIPTDTPIPTETPTYTPAPTDTPASTDTPEPTTTGTPVATNTPSATTTGTVTATEPALTATRTTTPETPTATAPPATATVLAQEAATATAVSETAGSERQPRQIPSFGGCGSEEGGVPWLYIVIGGIGLVAIGAGGAMFVMQRPRT